MINKIEFWHIWYEIFENGKVVKTGQYHRSYRHKNGARRKAYEVYGDIPNLRWTVSETFPWETKGERPMATAKKCDRCGKYYENNEPYIIGYGQISAIDGIAFTLKDGGFVGGYDLCDECIHLLEKWLKGE